MSDWQPIETAPKDEDIAIWISDGKTVEGAAWINGRWVAHTGTSSVWEGDGDRGGLVDADCNPTHWMPLPNPPTGEA